MPRPLLLTFLPFAVVLSGGLAALGCGAPAVHDAPKDPAPARARASAAAVATPADPAVLAADVERRGVAVLPGGDLATVFSKKGNVVVSPFGAGLTLVTAEALSSQRASEYQSFTALTGTVAACFGLVHFEHSIVFAREIAVSREASEVAWKLSPGTHMGVDEPPGAVWCARAYTPLRSASGVPSLRDLLPAGEVHKDLTELRGARLGRSRTVGAPRFAHCRETTVGFRACGEADPKSADAIANMLTGDGTAPPGIEVGARGHVEETGDASIVVLPADATGIAEHSRRRQSVVLVVPNHPCDAPALAFDPVLLTRVRDAVKAPRDVDVRVVMPDLETDTDMVSPKPAPLDGFVLSTSMYSPICPSFAKWQLDKDTRRFAPNQPFLYALVDDDTRAVLVMGRFERLDRKRPRPVVRQSTPSDLGGLQIGH